MQNRLYWIAVGGFAFWLPVILLSAINPWNVSVLALNSASLTGLVVTSLATRIMRRLTPRWGWILAGVYIFGPTAIFIAASFSLTPHSRSLREWIWLILFCLFPPMTLWLATLDGMIFSVLFATIVLPILALSRLGRH
jgi:hypothetical protein